MSGRDPLQRLIAAAGGVDDVRLVVVEPDGRMTADVTVEGAVLPGSFNPLHAGHRRLAAVVAELAGTEVAFELSIVNVDKPPLEEVEVLRRLRQFHGRGRVVLTRAPRFIEKARLLPGVTFAIGWDTAVRLVDPRYYGDDERSMLAALGEMRAAGCRVLVAGREHEGVFRTLADVAVPEQFEDLFEAIPESRFRVDLSSSALRGE
jgi:hypothetical protein